MTLKEYCNQNQQVVLFWASRYIASGDYTALGVPGIDDTIETLGYFEAEGSVDESGHWNWNGEGDLFDAAHSLITNLTAFVSPKRWEELKEDYESEISLY